jgi:hypothetical protein
MFEQFLQKHPMHRTAKARHAPDPIPLELSTRCPPVRPRAAATATTTTAHDPSNMLRHVCPGFLMDLSPLLKVSAEGNVSRVPHGR